MKTIDDIIPDLIDLTNQNRLHWSASSLHGYKTRISPSFDVTVWKWVDPAIDEEGFTATLEKDGVQIDLTKGDRFAAQYPVLSRLYDTARREAQNVDASIGQVLQLLAGMRG